MTQKVQLFRASIVHFPHATNSPDTEVQTFADGGLAIADDKILALGEYPDLRAQYPRAEVHDHRGKWLLPGFIDSHLHYPQTEIIGQYGTQLLHWLETYTFPTEQRFSDDDYARRIAQVFLRQMLKNGTTSGLVFSTVHKSATDILFEQASELDMAIVAGKVCMDRNCPGYLQDDPVSAQRDSAELIERWHGNGRNLYALTPRFAPTSTEAQMATLGELAQQYTDVFIQTHLSENLDEIDWVKALYPSQDGYLAVYDKYHMVRSRAVFGHCIHLTEAEWQRLHSANATIAFCPTSNLFLGSGLFDLEKAVASQVHLTLATDVGGGTGFNLLRTYGEAYKICQLRHTSFSPLHGLYCMTQGAAVAHQLSDSIGNLNPGTHADFVILQPGFDELTQLRLADSHSAQDMLFAMSMLGDDRATFETWIAGKRVYAKSEEINHAVV